MPSFLSQTATFFQTGNTPGLTINVPTTGQTYKMVSGQREVYFNHAGTIAALTVWLPPGPKPGDVVSLKFRSIVTTLSVRNAAGVVVTGAPVTATAAQVQTYRYVDNTTGWMYW